MTVTKVKERRKRKSEEMERRKEKSNGCTLSFIMATLEKKTVGRKRSIWR